MRLWTDLPRLGISEVRSCVKVEVAVLGSRPYNKPTVSVDVKQRFNNSNSLAWACACGFWVCCCNREIDGRVRESLHVLQVRC